MACLLRGQWHLLGCCQECRGEMVVWLDAKAAHVLPDTPKLPEVDVGMTYVISGVACVWGWQPCCWGCHASPWLLQRWVRSGGCSGKRRIDSREEMW